MWLQLTVKLVIAAVDKQQRVGAARNAVDEDLCRSILHHRVKSGLMSVEGRLFLIQFGGRC